MLVFAQQLGLLPDPVVKAALAIHENLNGTAGLTTEVSPNSAQRRYTSGIIVAIL